MQGSHDLYFPTLLTGRFNTGIGRVAKTTFFLTIAEICHSTPAPSLFPSSSTSIPSSKARFFFSVIASGVGRETIFPSKR